MIYFTSDLHFYHNKPFVYEPRGFQNIYEMNEVLFRNWNEVITESDVVYMLGDFMLMNNAEGLRLLHQLRGEIHMIIGNHDTDERVRLYRESHNVVEVVYATILRYNGYRFYLSHYPTLCCHVDDRPPKKDLVNLYGHTHQPQPFFIYENGEENYRMYNVGVDAHGYKPVSIDQIIEDMNIAYKKRKHP